MISNLIPPRAPFTLAGALLAAAAALASRPALAVEDPAWQSYRCVVLGQSTACRPPSVEPAERIEETTTPGPYARYLIHVGQEAGRAIATARAIGEQPQHLTLRVTTRPLTAEESYERYLGTLREPQTRREVVAGSDTARATASADR